MRRAVLLALLLAVASCAKNRESEETGRIHDTTNTAKDSLRLPDTMSQIRDSMPDSTRK
jgi:hypothetical protein